MTWPRVEVATPLTFSVRGAQNSIDISDWDGSLRR